MKVKTKSNILIATGYSASIVAPLVATAVQFPIFIEKGQGATISGSFILVALIGIIPLLIYMYKMKKANKTLPTANSPAAIWGIILVCAIGLYQVLDQLIIISSAGLGGVVVQKICAYNAERVVKKEAGENPQLTLNDLTNIIKGV